MLHILVMNPLCNRVQKPDVIAPGAMLMSFYQKLQARPLPILLLLVFESMREQVRLHRSLRALWLESLLKNNSSILGDVPVTFNNPWGFGLTDANGLEGAQL